ELQEYLLKPIEELKLSARLYGVRYPQEGRAAVAAVGAKFCGWIANHRVPEVYRRFRFTVHIPRRPYRQLLRGIPTIRIFEALACGIPLITSEWSDAEELFHPGEDYLVAQDGEEMKQHIRRLLNEPQLADQLVARGLRTISERH